MRNIDQLSKLANVRTSPYMSFNTITGTEVFVHVYTDELRHLIAIAKAAEEVTCLNYDKCDVKQKVKEARKAGLFRGGE